MPFQGSELEGCGGGSPDGDQVLPVRDDPCLEAGRLLVEGDGLAAPRHTRNEREPCREREHEGRYEFLVDARLPLAGRIIRYEGWLAPMGDADA